MNLLLVHFSKCVSEIERKEFQVQDWGQGKRRKEGKNRGRERRKKGKKAKGGRGEGAMKEGRKTLHSRYQMEGSSVNHELAGQDM